MNRRLVLITVLCSLLFAGHFAFSQEIQWEQILPPPSGSPIHAIRGNVAGEVIALNFTGLYRLSNHQRGWTYWPFKEATFFTSSVVTASGALIVAGTTALRRSTDLGLTWSTIMENQVNLLKRDAQGSIYVMKDSTAQGLFVSDDEGETWRRLQNGLSQIDRVNNISVSEEGSIVVAGDGRLLRWNAGRSQWELLALSLPARAMEFIANDQLLLSRQDEIVLFNLSTRTSTTFPQKFTGLEQGKGEFVKDRDGNVYISSSLPQIYRLFAGAALWETIDLSAVVESYINGIYVTSNDDVLIATDRGIYRYSAADNQTVPLNLGLTELGLEEFVLARGGAIIGSSGRSIYRLAGSDSRWQQQQLTAPFAPRQRSIMALKVADDHSILAAVASTLYRSTDEGISWQAVAPFPLKTDNVFYSARGDFFTTKFAESSVLRASEGEWRKIRDVKFLAMAEDERGLLFSLSSSNRMEVSDDDGESWHILPNPLGRSPKATLYVSPTLGLLASNSTGSFASIDRGTSWRLLNPMEFRQLLELNSRLLLGRGDTVLYQSRDSGRTFESIFTLPSAITAGVRLTDMLVHKDVLYLNAESHGLFRSASVVTSVAESPPVIQQILQLRIAPQPAIRELHVEFEVSRAAALRVDIFDNGGRLRRSSEYLAASAGTHSFSLGLDGLSAGLYHFVVQTDRDRVQRQIVIRR